MSESPAIILCQCEQARVLPMETLELVARRLSEAGVAYEEVPDLCELVARRDPRLLQWANGPVKIAACFPRAVQWLFAAAGAPLITNAQLINLREGKAEEKVAAFLSLESNPSLTLTPVLYPRSLSPSPSQGEGRGEEAAISPSSFPPENWPAWFPVIDYDRCTQCMQCLGFCLFGVYGVDASQSIQVKNPAQCKINCPACSRVCPQGAILFPKHKTGPINGQDVTDAAAQSGRKLDISALLGGDAHALLRDRNARAKSRFSKDRTEDQALSERRKYLAQHGLIAEDVPSEVLMSLPSPEVIARKVEEAAARAKAALEARERL